MARISANSNNVESVFNYLHHFKNYVIHATIKFAIPIKNGRSLKLLQMHQVDAQPLPALQTKEAAHQAGVGRGRSGQRGEDRGEKERQEGCHVTR